MAIAEAAREPITRPPAAPWTAVLHDWVTTVDHKKIGILYVIMAVVFLVIGGVQALLLRWQLMWPRYDFIGPDTFNQMFTMHGQRWSSSWAFRCWSVWATIWCRS